MNKTKVRSLFIIILVFSMLLFCVKITVRAAATEEALSAYEETIHIDNVSLPSNGKSGHITASKTGRYKDSRGNTLWSVTVTASFSYDGSTSKCTSVSASAVSYSSYWNIIKTSSSKNGNEGKAKAVARHTSSRIVNRTVTIKCSKTGILS